MHNPATPLYGKRKINKDARMWWLALALVLLLIVFVKPRAVWAILALAVLVCAAGALHYFRQEDRKGAIAVEAAYAPGLCPGDRPMRVSIHNGADVALERVQFSIHARRPGFSTVITPYTYKQNVSDKILEPGERFEGCYPLPPFSRDGAGDSLNLLEWEVEVNRVFFR